MTHPHKLFQSLCIKRSKEFPFPPWPDDLDMDRLATILLDVSKKLVGFYNVFQNGVDYGWAENIAYPVLDAFAGWARECPLGNVHIRCKGRDNAVSALPSTASSFIKSIAGCERYRIYERRNRITFIPTSTSNPAYERHVNDV